MMTDGEVPVDAGAIENDLADGLWETISEIARMRDVSRQAIAKRVSAFEADGLVQTKPGPGGTKLVNLAQFDRAIGETGDIAKESAHRDLDDDKPEVNTAFRDAATREKQYAADLKFLDLEERLGRLVPVSEIEQAAIACGEQIIRIVDRLPTKAEALVAANQRDGVTGMRVQLKEIVREFRSAISEAMTIIAKSATPAMIETAIEGDAVED